MRVQQFAAGAAILLAAISLAEARAGFSTVRVPVVKDRSVPLSLQQEGVRVASYRLDRLVRASTSSFKLGQGPNVRLSVLNQAGGARAFSIAVAIFDREGGLVAAGSSDREKLKPGESDDLMVTFTGVNQNLARAEWIYLTIETHFE